MAGLAEGAHVVYIEALDSLGNWGMPGTVTLSVDLSGPLASNIVVWPTPNNGYRALLPSLLVVRLEALFSDPFIGGVNSTLGRAEGFIDAVGTPGSGFPLIANDGLWDEISEPGYVHIPLLTIRQLDPGLHTLYVRAKDAAGNWGPAGSVIIVIDKAGPDITALAVRPDPTGGATGVILTALATDPANPGGASASNLVAAEWFDGTDPGAGNGLPVGALDGIFDSPSEALRQTISVIGWRPGKHLLSVRGLDEAGNWGPTTSITVTVHGGRPNAIFSDGFESGNFAAWDNAVGSVSVVPEAAMGGTSLGMAAVVNGPAPAYVVDGTPEYEARYWATFYFHPNGTDTGDGQHDILAARDDQGTPIFGLQYEHSAGGGYEVRAWVRHSGGLAYTPWHEFGNTPHRLGIWWESDPAGSVRLMVDDLPVQGLNNLDTSDFLADEVWLGPSAGLQDGMSGVEYFDEFTSIRSIYAIYMPLVIR